MSIHAGLYDAQMERNVAQIIISQRPDEKNFLIEIDRVVSIEMLAAAGEAYWPAYVPQPRARLCCLQARPRKQGLPK
jgi:cyclopropane fatty-acyl-phospholipid synthase-like methyltransferase